MARQLIESTDPVTGDRTWVDADTGEERSIRRNLPATRVRVGDLLFEEDAALHDKLLNGRPMTWPEISRATDIMMRAVSQDSLRTIFSGVNLRQARAAIQTMILAQVLSTKLSPRLQALSGGATIGSSSAKDAQSGIRSLLTLPGQR